MRISLLLLSLLVAGSALAAGQVEVSMRPYSQLTDAGNSRFDGERNLALLKSHLEALGQRLPDGQTLKVELLDLDMAGTVKPTRNGQDLRVLKGAADWPTLTLRWTLSAGGRTLESRKERISDMSYLMAPLRVSESGPLAYELRLVDRWFAERFGARSTASIR